MRLTYRPALTAAILFFLGALAPNPGLASGILPAGAEYDPSMPHPRETLGFEVGEWHVRHDQLVAYLEKLAEASDRVTLEVQGRTHEGRRQILLTVSSPSNLSRIDEIRRAHLTESDPAAGGPAAELPSDQPVVVWLGYSIHGNEASGSNAALLVAYHLAAARGPEIEEQLANAVILIDPSLNPDGLGRFAHWANIHRGSRPVADPNHREHREAWPGGRFNHYWFDLNRDWLLLQHPESRARVATLQRWRPNVVGDFHEMGSNSTYFFQPGVPERRNPLTPERNVELTRAIAEHHAAALDRAGSLYYTQETFDDFYYGKGSTYPDVQGAVGILFEQASARGHVQETVDGPLTFSAAIRNQFLTSLSTLRGALENRRELLSYQTEFFRDARTEARDSGVRGWIFGDEADPPRTRHMAEILLGHGIEIHRIAETVKVSGNSFAPGSAFLVPTEQRQYRLIRALFDRVTEFTSSTFYDISSWCLPLAFAMPTAELGRGDLKSGVAGERVRDPADLSSPPAPAPSAPPGAPGASSAEPVAYAFAWDSYYAPRALYRLLAAGVRARVAARPFSALTASRRVELGYGAIVVPSAVQEVAIEELHLAIEAIRLEDGVEVHEVASGLTPKGLDLGSPSLRPLEPIKPLLLVGRGVSPTEVGELWHLLDHRFGIEIPLVETHVFEDLDLGEYTHILLVNSRRLKLKKETVTNLRRWLRQGGTVIATKGAAVWAAEKLVKEEEATQKKTEAPPKDIAAEGKLPVSYDDYEEDRAVEIVSGAILEIELDLTHPLAYGYNEPRLPVFRNGTHVLEASPNPYENVAFYSPEPRLSGYISEENLKGLAGSPAVIASRVGKGSLIRLADDPNFRAYFYGSNKLFMNALFFGPILKETQAPSRWK